MNHCSVTNLTSLLIPFDQDSRDWVLSPSQKRREEAIIARLKQNKDQQCLVQLTGPDHFSKQVVAIRASAHFNRQIVRLPVGVLPTTSSELDTLARLWARENPLTPLALYLDAYGETQTPAGQKKQTRSPFMHFISRINGLIFLDTRKAHPDLKTSSLIFDIEKPTPQEQQQAWEEILGEGMEKTAARLAEQFNLNLSEILNIGCDARIRAGVWDPEKISKLVWQSCLAATRPRIEQFAHRIEPHASWEDLVLPNEQVRLLRQIADRVSHRATKEWKFPGRLSRGLGVSALFTGKSGTGKTMAAEVLANQLGLDLYIIDLSAVVSKYISETEKNLRRLFDAAEDGGAILFFDEADALFGKRSEVKDSHDRYANIEINYLLQCIENYRGLVILSFKKAIDPAFLLKFHCVVEFPISKRRKRKQSQIP